MTSAPEEYMSMKLAHADSATSLRQDQIIEAVPIARKSKKLAKKKKMI